MSWARIAVAGFQHETNTFAPSIAELADFQMADSWPRMLLGAEAVTETRGMNLPIAGAVAAAKAQGDVEIVPILWTSAEPSGPVTDAAFEWIATEILDRLRQAGPFDAIYLDLHGAMVTESHADGEAALLLRLRAAFGPSLPIGLSLDLHANLSQTLVDAASVITIYRTYPHLDMAETGARCFAALLEILQGRTYFAAFRQAPFLIALHAQCTDLEPVRSLYAKLPDTVREFADIALGFTAADVADCGPSVLAYAASPRRAAEMADDVWSALCAAEPDVVAPLMEPRAAVQQAMAFAGPGPVVLADVQDNPGAGGTSDTTGLLQAMVDLGAREALLGVICDPVLAARAHRLGIGASFDGQIGGAHFEPGPIAARLRVEALSDGVIAYAGEMYGGGTASVGPSCCLVIDAPPSDVRIVVSSVRIQALDTALFTHFGLRPAAARIVGVKSTVHFRADFAPLAGKILSVAAPGAFPCRLGAVAYRNLRPGVRRI